MTVADQGCFRDPSQHYGQQGPSLFESVCLVVTRGVFQTDSNFYKRLEHHFVEELTPVDEVFEEVVALHDGLQQEFVKGLDRDLVMTFIADHLELQTGQELVCGFPQAGQFLEKVFFVIDAAENNLAHGLHDVL